MFTSSLTSFLAALLLVGSNIMAFPVDVVERAPLCKKDDYGAFRLYAAPADGSKIEWQQVKLIDLYTPRPTNDTIQALSVCPADDCGHLPSYWVLTNGVLSAVFEPGQPGYSTVNRPVQANSVVQFVNSDNASIKKVLSPQWCAVRQPGTTSGLPGYLSVKGSPEFFSICTNIPTVGPPARADVYYKANVMDGGLEKYCTKIHLVMQSIGIIAEPIPA